ncbi:MAG TPA: phosphatidate cytidylyltransferase [Candidatus Onthomorpha intestinigallinarum]|uniref:Phosphatidate cytidylyltransferase n=1 Tax=Candidatus Onthomorpha intestinigallinarum TaxID=2840880 RepID=A0A9D1RG59_9BACT|nr:phosphatidate cytidylyltransferase [Candidatus Onthomorpha intestinigallinarum]
MKDLLKRTVTGAVYVLSVILAICIDARISSVYFGIVALLAVHEFVSITTNNLQKLNAVLTYLTAASVYATVALYSFGVNHLITLALAVLGILALFITELYGKDKNPFTSISYSLCGLVYIVFPLSLTNFIIQTGGGFEPYLLLAVFIFAWCNDTFAYLVGSKFGRHKLFERHSPKKSWEGFFGGFVATLVAALIMNRCVDGFVWWDWMALAVITTVVGTFGDLTESMFKRQMGVKDSGRILPGHGGILDRFDILLAVLPVAWVYLILAVN